MFLPFLKNLLKNVNYSSDVDTMWCPGWPDEFLKISPKMYIAQNIFVKFY
jgi:hypothetical protein